MSQIAITPKAITRFWSKVNKTESCWLWMGSKTKDGHGQMTLKRTIGAHVFSWMLHRGPVLRGTWILHNCPGGDNAACVNPDRLWIGDATSNSHDKIKKGRANYVIGERVLNSKLNKEKVIKIREIRSEGWSGPKLAIRFSVGVDAIYRVCHGRAWVSVQ